MFENKKKFALWMYPDTLQKVGEIYRGDNCESKFRICRFVKHMLHHKAGNHIRCP